MTDYNNLSDGQLDQQIAATESAMNSVGVNTEPPAPEKPNIFGNDSESRDQLSDELGRIFDKHEAQADREDARLTVPHTAKNLDEAFTVTGDWLGKSAKERRTLQEGRTAVDELKARARDMGVELADDQAVTLALQLESQQAAKAPAELAPAMQSVRELYGDQVPFHQAAQRYAEIDRLVRSDPVQGLAWIAQQSGLHPLQLAQQLAQRYGNQPMQPQSQEAAYNAMTAEIERVASGLENFENYEADILAIIENGEIKRTNNPMADLKAAHSLAVRREAKLSKDQKLEKRLRRAYDKAQSKRA